MELALFVAGAVVGFVTNLITNEMTAKRHERIENESIKARYAAMVGSYAAFAIDSELIDFSKPTGDCRIEYQGPHTLKLHYQEVAHDFAWEADIWMESPFSGFMVWRYVKLYEKKPTPLHRFGFKRCAFFEKPGRDGTMKKYFYLIGEDGFGKEALEKK